MSRIAGNSKLRLSKTTLRALSNSTMATVAGGGLDRPDPDTITMTDGEGDKTKPSQVRCDTAHFCPLPSLGCVILKP
jgi:hypothetical protein